MLVLRFSPSADGHVTVFKNNQPIAICNPPVTALRPLSAEELTGINRHLNPPVALPVLLGRRLHSFFKV